MEAEEAIVERQERTFERYPDTRARIITVTDAQAMRLEAYFDENKISQKNYSSFYPFNVRSLTCR